MDLRGVKLALVRPEVGAVSGPNAWPAADVEVRDAHGKALLVQRTGIEWSKLSIPSLTEATTCFVQAVEPPSCRPGSTTDEVSGRL